LITGDQGPAKNSRATIHNLSPRPQRGLSGHQLLGDSDTLMESELFGHEEGRLHRRSLRGGMAALSWPTLAPSCREIGEMPLCYRAKLLPRM